MFAFKRKYTRINVKDILDIVILVMFTIMVLLFIINFNRQQIQKHKDRLDKNSSEKKEDKNDE